jgi:hypothetical protein
MRDLDVLLNSLINIDRKSLIAILSSEVEAARQLVSAARQRTASQRTKRREAVEHLAWVDRILSFFQHGDIAPDMSEDDFELCKSVEQKDAREVPTSRFAVRIRQPSSSSTRTAVAPVCGFENRTGGNQRNE